MNHLTEDELTLLYYGELSAADARSARAHLDSCAACHAENEKLQRLFAMVDTSPLPEPAVPRPRCGDGSAWPLPPTATPR
jgi:anti-sigma factor RsiW